MGTVKEHIHAWWFRLSKTLSILRCSHVEYQVAAVDWSSPSNAVAMHM